MARLQRGIALLVLIGLIVVNVGVITPAVPELAEYTDMVGALRVAGWVCAAIVLAVDILWPALTLWRLRKNAAAKQYS